MTRLEILCLLNNQQGGTIHQFSDQYDQNILGMTEIAFDRLVLNQLTQSITEFENSNTIKRYQSLLKLENYFRTKNYG